MSNSSSIREDSSRSASVMDYSRNVAAELASEEILDYQDDNVALQSNNQFEVSTKASQRTMSEHQMSTLNQNMIKLISEGNKSLRLEMRKMISEGNKSLKLEMKKMINEANEPLILVINQLGQRAQRSQKRIQRIQEKIGLLSSGSPIKAKGPADQLKKSLGAIKQNVREEEVEEDKEEEKQENRPKGFQIEERYSFLDESGAAKKIKLVHSKKVSQKKQSERNKEASNKEEKSVQKFESLPILGQDNKITKSVGYPNFSDKKKRQKQSGRNKQAEKKEQKSGQKLESLPIIANTKMTKSVGYQNEQDQGTNLIERWRYPQGQDIFIKARISNAKSRQALDKMKVFIKENL